MMKLNDLVQRVILLGVFSISLIILPNLFYYPFITPKFTLLILFSTCLIFLLFFYKSILFKKSHRLAMILVASFITWTLITLIVSNVYITDGLFGFNNRNDGAITYISLAIFFISSLVASSNTFNWKITKSIIIMGILSACYGIIQILGLDLFQYFNRYNQVITFFGNPNLQSSFMGISAIAAFAHLRNIKIRITFRVALLVFIALSLFVIEKSDSTQGYLVFLFGTSIVILYWFRFNKNLKSFEIIYFIALVLLLLSLILDLLQKSPWKSLLYQSSISYRGDFWRAAWRMTFDNPLFGVGITGYRDNYRINRDSVAVTRSEYNQGVESAHNRFLDVSSSGGIILLLIYVAIVLLVIISGIKVVKRSTEINPSFIAVFACWFGYLAQSTISVFSFANDLIGWTLAGLIIGFEIQTRDPSDSNSSEKKISSIPMVGIALLVQLIFMSTYIQSELNFKSAIEKGEVNQIIEKVEAWPKRNDRYYLVIQLLEKGGFPDRSLEIARKAVSLWPNNFESWQLLYFSPNATISEKDKAFSVMKKLDPFNPILNK
jgi:O-antigen ligase